MKVLTDGRAIEAAELPRQFGVDEFYRYNAAYLATIGNALTLSDKMHGRMLFFEDNCTITVPVGLRRDFSCGWSQDGVDALTFVEGAGATIQSLNDLTDSGGQFADGAIYAVPQANAATASVYRLMGALA